MLPNTPHYIDTKVFMTASPQSATTPPPPPPPPPTMSILQGIRYVHQVCRSTVLWPCHRLRDEHTVRTKAESELESMKGQAAAYKEKLQEATAGQAQAARLAADLEVEQTLHKEAKSHIGTLESRYTVLT